MWQKGAAHARALLDLPAAPSSGLGPPPSPSGGLVLRKGGVLVLLTPSRLSAGPVSPLIRRHSRRRSVRGPDGRHLL